MRYFGEHHLANLRCPVCGADLTRPASVMYLERYDARLDWHRPNTVIPSSSSVDSAAKCANCGLGLEYGDVDFVG